MADHIVGQNDTLDPIVVELIRADGKYETVGSSDVVTLYMQEVGNPSVTQTHVMTLTDQATARYQYNWVALDTVIPGLYNGKFRMVRASDGAKKTFPNDEVYYTIKIAKNFLP